jgi:hypothetical protein
MRKRIAAAALGVALVGVPAVAQAEKNQKGQAGYEQAVTHALERGDYEPYEERYLRRYDRFADEFGVQSAGRNVVLFGVLKKDGEQEAKRARVKADASEFATALNPPETAYVPATTESSTTTSYGAATSSTAQCESGGDYTAVNPAGYYGAYQFDQSTWDAYAPSGYAGTNPAEAPPEVQDAAAANVPYDAWPSC